ncbi:MAG: ATP-binding cassette domain-containing protein [Bacteroidota bacterium]
MARIFASATAIRYNSYSVEMIYNDLVSSDKDVNNGVQLEFKSETSIDFNDKVELRNVSYQYPDAENLALKNIALSVPKQYFVGLVGPSGAGKTTMVDIILGLLTPTHGEVLVDGKNIKENLSGWQRKIGYIPQNIYLSDDTIRRNIAFGLYDEKIDDNRVWSVLENAQLNTFIKGLPNKLDTMVGERGIRLSGGQRQRIGIARALYHNPEVLIMDEGTASLDNETEWGIMQALNSLSGKKTIIIIAHRLSTVKNCDLLYFIKDGTVIERGTYDEV